MTIALSNERSNPEELLVKIKSQRDFWSGIMFTVLGVIFAYGATSYNIGSAAKMGPGYFPLMLGVVLALLGAAVTLRALSVQTADGEPIDAFDWKTTLIVLGSVCLFGFLLPTMGLMLALLALVIGSSLASHEFTWKGTLISAVFLIALCLVVFVWALKLQFNILPAFLR
jgi:Tripartite tricarboxylate transporter TctB family